MARRMLLVFLVLVSVAAGAPIMPLQDTAPNLHMVLATGVDAVKNLTLATIDATTGQFTTKPIEMPPTSCERGSWGVQTALDTVNSNAATVFYMNSTLFFLALELCPYKPGLFSVINSTLFSVFPFQGKARIEGRFPPADLSASQIAWDFTCNIIVVIPDLSPFETTYQSLEVSFYDDQQRPLPAQGTVPTSGRRVPLGGALAETGPWATASNEENCGDHCSIFHLEFGAPTADPELGRLVGRSVRHGQVTHNVSDPTLLTSLVYSSAGGYSDGYFFGLGVCCDTAAWCPPQCAGHDGKISIVGFNSSTTEPPSVVYVLTDSDATAEKRQGGLRLGATIDLFASKLAVFYSGKVQQFAISKTDQSLTPLSSAPVVLPEGTKPVMWGFLAF